MKLTISVNWYGNMTFSFSEAVTKSLLTTAESMLLGVLYYDCIKVTDICDDELVSVIFDTSITDKAPSRYIIAVDLKEVDDADTQSKVKSVLTSIGINFTEDYLSIINTKYLNPEGVLVAGNYTVEE